MVMPFVAIDKSLRKGYVVKHVVLRVIVGVDQTGKIRPPVSTTCTPPGGVPEMLTIRPA